jgi:hypothetical protein
MSGYAITTTEKVRTTRPRAAGQRAQSFERTEWACSCGRSGVILWNRALLRRLEREGLSRADYVAQVTAMHEPSHAHLPR